jgi:hypothetical protein
VVRSPKFGQNSSARKVCFFIFINSTLVFEKQTNKQKNKKTKKQKFAVFLTVRFLVHLPHDGSNLDYFVLFGYLWIVIIMLIAIIPIMMLIFLML